MTWSLRWKWKNKIDLLGYKFMLLSQKLSDETIQFQPLRDDHHKIIGTQIL